MFISWDRKLGPRNKSSCSAPLGVIIHLTSLGFPQEFGSKGNVLCRASWARKGFLVHPTDHCTNLPLLQLRCKRAIHTIISGMHFCFKDTIHWRLKTSKKIMIKSRSRYLMKTHSFMWSPNQGWMNSSAKTTSSLCYPTPPVYLLYFPGNIPASSGLRLFLLRAHSHAFCAASIMSKTYQLHDRHPRNPISYFALHTAFYHLWARSSCNF